MTNTINGKATRGSYFIRDFMHGLGLKTSELLVYAMLYSFTLSKGSFIGSREYIASQTELSKSTVKRALASLTERGLISSERSEGCRVLEYRAFSKARKDETTAVNERASAEQNSAARSVCEDGENMGTDAGVTGSECTLNALEGQNGVRDQNGPVTGSRRTFAGVSVTPINSCYNNNNTTPTPPPQKTREAREKSDGVRYRVIYPGHERAAFMSEEQYNALCRMVDGETLEQYILRLEAFIVNGQNHDCLVHSHYKLLKKWIEEDLALT